MAMKPLYQVLASKVAWNPTTLHKQRREDEITQIIDALPSGSGWDDGTEIDLDRSSGNKIVLYGSYHHMNDNGCYVGSTSHEIIVTPDLANGFTLRITGLNRREIKGYLYEMFDAALRESVNEWA